MAPDDPFFDDVDPERTIIRPMPGRQGGQPNEQPGAPRSIPAEPAPVAREAPVAARPRVAGYGATTAQGSFESMLGRSINPLLGASSPLLVLANQLKNTAAHTDVEGLRGYAAQLMTKCEAAVRQAGYTDETVITARYVLCVFVDESVLGTPWGSESHWGADSLLNAFHNETKGGEKFFVLLERLVQQPASHIDLLELFYVCLAMGFRGKYGVAQMGSSQLSDMQGNLYRTIIGQRNDFERELSPRWAGVPDKRNALERYVPLWVVAALAGVLLLMVFAGFRVILDNTSDPVIQGLNQLGQAEIAAAQTTDD